MIYQIKYVLNYTRREKETADNRSCFHRQLYFFVALTKQQ